MKTSLSKIEEIIGWQNWIQLLKIMKDFMKSLSKDRSSIADIIPSYIKARTELYNMNNEASLKLADYLKKRFNNIHSFHLPSFAYLLTKNGLEYYRKNQNSNCEIINCSYKGMNGYLNERHISKAVCQLIQTSFDNYLKYFNLNYFLQFDTSYDMWWSFCLSLSNKPLPFLFSEFVTDVLTIPSSEVAVERVFASLSLITTKNMCNILPITINARLTIKYDSIFNKVGNIKFEDFGNDEKNPLQISEK